MRDPTTIRTGPATITPRLTRNRTHPISRDYCDALQHVSCGSASQIKASQKHDKFRDEAEVAFDDAPSLTYTELRDRIMETVPLKEDAAKKRIA